MEGPLPTNSPRQAQLRLWPGVVLASLLLVCRFLLPYFFPDTLLFAIMSGLAGAGLIFLWWTFFSRAPRIDRFLGLGLIVLALALTRFLVLHPSIAGGMMGLMFWLYSLPILALVFTVAVVASANLPLTNRRLVMAAAVVAVCAGFGMIRTGGMTGDADSEFAFRWTPTPEEQLLAQADEGNKVRLMADPQSGTEWPGFRGALRDGVVAAPELTSDWAKTPPQLLWKKPIGPGWASFAVHGNLLFTQEQRGKDELVSTYHIETGEAGWKHRDVARFWESNGGAGPRSTPTLAGERVYTLGGTGILNALDAATGKVLWSRNPATEYQVKTPDWGFSGSPLVVGDQVLVPVAGLLASYDAATGEPRWKSADGGDGYSSPHLVRLAGVEQVVQITGKGVMGVSPSDGKILWEHDWKGYPIVQPALTADGDLLIAVNQGSGLRRLAISQDAAGAFKVEERWTSNGLKPYFSDFAVHDGHAYGFDGNILSCIDLKDGTRKWKGGRYGNGQLLLLSAQNRMLILSEQGEIALVKAEPGGFEELARLPAIEGKTWNHPVLVGDILLVRNDREMAAFRLARS